MAKLKHLATLIEKMNGGDTARTNSLVMVARKAGLFTIGGRGPNAPEMWPTDFGRALLLGTTLATPTRAAETVKTLEAARPFIVKIDPMDGGGFRDVDPDESPLTGADAYENPYLPSFLSDMRGDLAGFLEELFASLFAGEWSFQDWDEFRVRDAYGRFEISFLLHGARYIEGKASGYNEVSDDERTPAHYGWEFVFHAEKPTEHHEFFGAVDRVIYSNALKAFQELARGGEDG
jgi:hypothetical protein